MTTSDFEAQIRKALEEVSEVSVAVLFGSRATGTARADSDMDVALLTEGESRARRKLLTRVMLALADLAPAGRVDVVFVDEAPALLRQRIMEKGRVLICRDPGLWRQWRIRTMREFGDREHVRRLLRRAQWRRLQRGEHGGRSGRALRSLERSGRLSR